MLFLTLLAVAAIAYFVGLGRAGFDDAEAYSAYIASRPSVAAVLEASRQLDPGKGGGLYAFILHWYCAVFGSGEVALRAFSAIFALGSVVLVYALTADLFETDTAFVAASLWAFNPIALIIARWARMYSLFVALALDSLLAMRRLQRRPTSMRIAAFAGLGAAMLYTHLGGALILAGEAAILARERWRGRAIAAEAAGLALALMLFVPIAPNALAQVHASALGHRFDWMGSAVQLSLAARVAIGALAAMVAIAIVFGPAMRHDDDSEPLRWCAMWTLLPLLALAAGSMILHPMFEIRYIAPVVAGAAILAAAGLKFAEARVRNLIVVALTFAFLIPAMLFYRLHPPFDLWRRIARTVEASGEPAQEVFFEAGYVMGIRQAAGLDPDALVEVLPLGYLRIPFDYYFRGSNPRLALNPFRTDLARQTLARAARRDDGAWLVSHMNDADLVLELPSREEFVSERIVYDESVSVSLYRIVPRETPR